MKKASKLDGVPVKEKPDMRSADIATLDKDDVVDVLSYDNIWDLVEITPKIHGYVRKNTLKETKDGSRHNRNKRK